MSERISFVIPKKLRKSLRELQELSKEDQSTLLRRLLDKGIADAKLDIAIQRYIDGNVSLEQGANIADVSLWRFLDELRKRNVQMKYTLEDAKAEADQLRIKRK
jgi:predicted HTH domain antitoxin